MFGFSGGESAETVARKRGYMREAQQHWAFLTNFDASTIKNEIQLTSMIKDRTGSTEAQAKRTCEPGCRASILMRRRSQWNSPRLTGLEYFWFSRGQLAAARHPMRGTPGPEVAMAVLMEDIIKDARTFADGPRSLRHVANRFALTADEVRAKAQAKHHLTRGVQQQTTTRWLCVR
jgi:hypothetical protein